MQVLAKGEQLDPAALPPRVRDEIIERLARAAQFVQILCRAAGDSAITGEHSAETGQHVQEAVGVMLYTEDGNLRPLEEIEADVIRLAIGHYRGRMTEVARRLGIGRSTLYRKLSDLGIDNAA